MDEALVELMSQERQDHQSCDLPSLRSRMIDMFANLPHKPELFLDFLFFQGIHDSLSSEEHRIEHLYMRRFDIPQIVLYDTLANQFPFVYWSHQIANDILIASLCTADQSGLIDVGIGRGAHS